MQGRKKSKQRITVAFIVNAAGGKETPIVIWKSERPRCFKGIDKNSLPVTYFGQNNAWMTAEIFDTVLTKLNRQLSAKSRSVLLLIDIAGCHPREFKEKYSNIKIVFLPPNTTLVLQPLDLGVIQNFKTHYRKRFLRYVLAKIDECTNAAEVAKSINVLTAIRWVSQAWGEVKEETIQKCFRKAGLLNDQLSAVTSGTNVEEDPFEDVDVQLQDLISRSMSSNNICSVDEYINGDNCLSVCDDFDKETWEDDFLASLDTPTQPDIEEEDDMEDVPPPLKIKNFQEAIQSLEDVKYFLETRGCMQEATKVHTLIDAVAYVHSSTARQTNIQDFFH